MEDRPREQPQEGGLAALLRDRKDEVTARWAEAIKGLPHACDLPSPRLLDEVPDLLGDLADFVGGAPEDASKVSEAYDRFELGDDLAEVVAECAALRRCLSELVATELPSADPDQVRRLHGRLDQAVQAAVAQSVRARRKTLEGISHITSLVLSLREAPVEELLRELLDVLQQSIPSVDVGAILLAEAGGLLRTRASVGLDEEDLVVPIGDGFAGAIAAERRARELEDAATDPLVTSPALRARGIKALVGLPLLLDGELLGVVYVGSLHVSRFSELDTLVVRVLAERASSLLAQQRGIDRLREGEEGFRLLVDGAQDHAIYLLDPGGFIQTWNKGAERVKGWRAEDVIGEHVSLFFPLEEVSAGVPEQMLETAVAEDRAEVEGWRVRGDGARFWAEEVITTLRRPDCSVRGFVKITRDATRRRESEQAAKARERQQAAIAALGVQALEGADVQSLLTEATRVVAATLDVELCAVLELLPGGREFVLRAGVGWHEGLVGRGKILATPETLAGFVVEAGAPVVVEDVRRDRRFRLSVLLHEHGVASVAAVTIGSRVHPWGLIGGCSRTVRRFSADQVNFLQSVANVLAAAIERRTNELRQLELLQENERLYEGVRHVVESRDALLTVVSHDLRQPVGSILLSVSLLQRAGSRDEARTRRRLEVIRNAAESAHRMIEDLVSVAAIERGRLNVRRGLHEPRALVATAVEIAEPHAALRKVKLEVIVAEHDLLPAQLASDRDLVVRAIGNLLSNATRYSPEGGVVRVGLSVDGDQVRFAVSDDGPGIPANERARLFLEAAHWKRRGGHQGLGLGLRIVQGIAAAHGGRVGVECGEGGGSTLWFTVSTKLEVDPA